MREKTFDLIFTHQICRWNIALYLRTTDAVVFLPSNGMTALTGDGSYDSTPSNGEKNQGTKCRFLTSYQNLDLSCSIISENFMLQFKPLCTNSLQLLFCLLVSRITQKLG